MPFNVTIQNVGDKALGELLAKIGTKKYSVKVSHFHADANLPLDKPNGRVLGDAILSLTGKSARKDSRLYLVHTTLEKLEAKHEVGSITRDDLYNALVDKIDDPGGDISRALAGGYIRA